MSGNAKVLLVMNDEAECRTIASRLEEFGIETIQAHDGITGIAMVSDVKPDLVLCSRTLSKMGGLEVCRLIKRNHKLKHVAVLIVLDDGDDSAVVSSLEVGANDYLLRPLHEAELLAAVRSHLQHKTSIARLKDDNKELATILEISEMLTSTLSSADLFYIIVHKVAEALSVERCTLLRVDLTSDEATIEASMSPEDADLPQVPLHSLPDVARCLAGNKMVYVEDTRRDEELSKVHGLDEPWSVIAAPLQLRQPGKGRVVFRLARADEPFTYREIKFCQIVTTVAANALENAGLFESLELAHARLKEVAQRDPLTGVYNRGCLFERFEKEFARSEQHQKALGCILLDIDHFKRVNDDLGHQAGDRVLVEFARILEDCIRGMDFVGRYGGEEFLLVLPETDAEGALRVAERIRAAVREHEFQGVDDRRVSASLGVAVRSPGDDDVEGCEALIARADEALYRAKNDGRDRAVLHEAVTPVAVLTDE